MGSTLAAAAAVFAIRHRRFVRYGVRRTLGWCGEGYMVGHPRHHRLTLARAVSALDPSADVAEWSRAMGSVGGQTCDLALVDEEKGVLWAQAPPMPLHDGEVDPTGYLRGTAAAAWRCPISCPTSADIALWSKLQNLPRGWVMRCWQRQGMPLVIEYLLPVAVGGRWLVARYTSHDL